MEAKRRLFNIDVSVLSLVKKGANKKTIIYKSEDSPQDPTFQRTIEIKKQIKNSALQALLNDAQKSEEMKMNDRVNEILRKALKNSEFRSVANRFVLRVIIHYLVHLILFFERFYSLLKSITDWCVCYSQFSFDLASVDFEILFHEAYLINRQIPYWRFTNQI